MSMMFQMKDIEDYFPRLGMVWPIAAEMVSLGPKHTLDYVTIKHRLRTI